MAQGLSLHIGLNEVDPKHYVDAHGQPWKGELFACENDANDMAAVAGGLGYQVRQPLLTTSATSSAVAGAIREDADRLQPGDAYLLSYSGHGGQVVNTNPQDDPEADKLDETWCLFDRQLIDDELFELFSRFRPGVRILVLSDSCHSGSVTRGDPTSGEFRLKQLPTDVSRATEHRNEVLYADLQNTIPTKRLTSLSATVVLISGCQDDQFSRDGNENGAFTGAFLQAWQEEDPRRSLVSLYSRIRELIPEEFDQTPSFLIYGFEVAPALVI